MMDNTAPPIDVHNFDFKILDYVIYKYLDGKDRKYVLIIASTRKKIQILKLSARNMLVKQEKISESLPRMHIYNNKLFCNMLSMYR